MMRHDSFMRILESSIRTKPCASVSFRFGNGLPHVGQMVFMRPSITSAAPPFSSRLRRSQAMLAVGSLRLRDASRQLAAIAAAQLSRLALTMLNDRVITPDGKAWNPRRLRE